MVSVTPRFAVESPKDNGGNWMMREMEQLNDPRFIFFFKEKRKHLFLSFFDRRKWFFLFKNIFVAENICRENSGTLINYFHF